MTTVSCPKCSDEVALPAGASPKATVRCPLCQDEFFLSDILDSMPPPLIVVNDPEASASAIPETPAFGSAAAGIGTGELALGDPEPVSVTPSFGIESSVAPATSGKPTARKRRAAPRPKKKKSPAMEVVKVVLGGIVGLTIAQLILWWNPWKPTDPFDLAPKLKAAAPWILPAEFRGEKKQKAGNDETTGKKTPAKPMATPGKQDELPTLTFVDPNKTGAVGQPKESRRPGRKSKRPGSYGIMAAGNADATADVSKTKPAAVPDDPLDPEIAQPGTTDLGGDLVGDLSIDLDPTKMLDPPPSPEPDDSETESTEPADIAPSTPTRFPNARKMTEAELNEARKDAQTIARAWNLAEDADSMELLGQTYRALAELGEAITFAGQDSKLDEADVAGVLKSLADDDKKLALLGRAGAVWWQRSERDNAGVLLLGVVKSTEQHGDLYETKLAVSDGDSIVIVSLYNETDPADILKVDSDVLVLGAIIEDPASSLTGYEGDAESVVWSRLSVAVPK